jgi:hypothetical protein
MRIALSVVTLAAALISFTGCPRSASSTRESSAPAITWQEEGLSHGGANIKLGVRQASNPTADSIEPVAAITADGQPVAGAMVFVSLVDPAKESADSPGEVPTLYEPGSDDAPALYTPGPLELRAGTTGVRYRIVLPEVNDDFTHEISLP